MTYFLLFKVFVIELWFKHAYTYTILLLKTESSGAAPLA